MKNKKNKMPVISLYPSFSDDNGLAIETNQSYRIVKKILMKAVAIMIQLEKKHNKKKKQKKSH